jgi:hypothetical protein
LQSQFRRWPLKAIGLKATFDSLLRPSKPKEKPAELKRQD